MADNIAKGEEFEKMADKKIYIGDFFGSKDEEVAKLAASVFMKLSTCHLELNSKRAAAFASVDAAKCYKETSNKGAISCLELAVNIFLGIGRHCTGMAAKYCKEIGVLFELEQTTEKAILYYERAAEYFELAEAPCNANQCKKKVAQFSAQLAQYQKAVEIYEEIAHWSLTDDLLKYLVRGHLLNAGLCQLCRGDVVAIRNALERYNEFDPTFSRTQEYKFLSDLAAAIDEENVAKFASVIKKFDRINQLDPWKITLLLRVEDALKAQRTG